MLAFSLVGSYLAAFRSLLAQGVFPSLWIDFPCLTSQLFLVSHITLDKQRLLRFELLIQGSFTLYTCLEIPIHQRYLRRRREREQGLMCSSCHRAADAQAMNKQDAPFLDLSERSSLIQVRVLCQRRWRSASGLEALHSRGSSVRVDREVLTLAPWCRRASAKALPIPCAAPVTRATLPFTCMVGRGSAGSGRAPRLCSATAFMVPSARLCSGAGS